MIFLRHPHILDTYIKSAQKVGGVFCYILINHVITILLLVTKVVSKQTYANRDEN